MTNLKELQRTWDQLGHDDPMWAILTDPDKRGGGWDREAFFRTGEENIEQLMSWLGQLGIEPPRGAALDFGCGVGRLTQALAARCERAVGVDIAPRMIELARTFNRHGDACEYVLNERDDLGTFDDATFDLVYSALTLQHMEPRFAKRYLAEFLRVLRPGGLLVFQLPHRPAESAGWLRTAAPEFVRRTWYGLKRATARSGEMEMHGIPRRRVVDLLESNGGQVVEIQDDPHAAPGWMSLRYCVRRR
jgi:SAM-dependent methyltransferase